MKIGLSKKDFFGFTRVNLNGAVAHVEEKDSLMEPGKKSVHIYFNGPEGKGKIALSPKEVERIMHNVEGRMLMKNAEEEILKTKKSRPKKKGK